MAKKTADAPLEQSLEALEALVERMESGELSLDDSLKAFEQGIRLTRDCQHALRAAEQQVRILLEGEETAQPFTDDNRAPT